MSYRSTVELEGISLDLTYSIEGKFHAAGPNAPAEYPHPDIERCVLICGEVRMPVQFEELPESMRETAMYELQDEVDSLREPVEDEL